jgi:DNA uptake protein ComE-like DNA-binding protein
MKPWIKSYFHFSTIEKYGIVALSSVCILLLLSLFLMQSFVRPASSLQSNPQLAKAWEMYKQKNSTAYLASNETNNSSPAKRFPFDPNTIDSSGLLQLGMKAKTAHLLLNWRRKGKVFYRKEELSKLYTLSAEQYQQLAPYIFITAQTPSFEKKNYGNYLPVPEHLNINTTDSATLVRLRGIGPFYAHKLIEHRNALGGYHNFEQIKEAYHFSDSTLAMLQEKLIIDPTKVRKININTADITLLKNHPYIKERMAKNILLYRNAITSFEKIEQLRQVPLMNEEIYRKIAPYLVVE